MGDLGSGGGWWSGVSKDQYPPIGGIRHRAADPGSEDVLKYGYQKRENFVPLPVRVNAPYRLATGAGSPTAETVYHVDASSLLFLTLDVACYSPLFVLQGGNGAAASRPATHAINTVPERQVS